MSRYNKHDEDLQLMKSGYPTLNTGRQLDEQKVAKIKEKRKEYWRAERRVWLADAMEDIDMMGGNHWQPELYAAALTAIAIRETGDS